MGIGKEIYNKAKVGKEETVISSSATDLQSFQDVCSELEMLEQSGVLSITHVHHESQTGNRFVDIIRFLKLA